MITALGSVGIGLVWGWLLGTVKIGPRQLVRGVAALSLATLLVSLEVHFSGDLSGLIFFLSGAVIAMSVHLWWRQDMRLQFPRT